jgi:DNA-binding CsgD family transcriptional regulator
MGCRWFLGTQDLSCAFFAHRLGRGRWGSRIAEPVRIGDVVESPATPAVSLNDTGKDEPPLLTARHIECLAWAQEGKSAGDIGLIIGLTRRGVEKSFYTAYRRLGVRTRVQAVLRARELGLLGPQTGSRWIEHEQRQFKAPS